MNTSNTKRTALIGASMLTAVLAGCMPAEYGSTNDKMRQELFFKCMEKLPAGPVATQYNDWAEVVEECGTQALNMTWGCVKNCG